MTEMPARGPPPQHMRRDFRDSDRGHMQHAGHGPPGPDASIGTFIVCRMELDKSLRSCWCKSDYQLSTKFWNGLYR